MKSTETRVKVLYVMGVSRSGSTILDVTLGSHPGIESVGELRDLSRSGWIDGRIIRSPLCACGKGMDVHATDACPFWSSVRREWLKRTTSDNVENYAALQDAFERYRRWPRLLRERRSPSPQFRSYGKMTRALFESISAVSGKPVVVDSSKAPLRALALAMTPGIDLHLIHVVRDGRGVTWSRRQALRKDAKAGLWWDHKAYPVWNSAALWVGVNLSSEWVRTQLDAAKSMRIRYEDFMTDPGNTLERVGSLIRLDLAEVAHAASAGSTMEVGHNAGGNRIRMSKGVRLRPDVGEWRSKLSVKEQQSAWALMGWLMPRYGYEK